MTGPKEAILAAAVTHDKKKGVELGELNDSEVHGQIYINQADNVEKVPCRVARFNQIQQIIP